MTLQPKAVRAVSLNLHKQMTRTAFFCVRAERKTASPEACQLHTDMFAALVVCGTTAFAPTFRPATGLHVQATSAEAARSTLTVLSEGATSTRKRDRIREWFSSSEECIVNAANDDEIADCKELDVSLRDLVANSARSVRKRDVIRRWIQRPGSSSSRDAAPDVAAAPAAAPVADEPAIAEEVSLVSKADAMHAANDVSAVFDLLSGTDTSDDEIAWRAARAHHDLAEEIVGDDAKKEQLLRDGLAIAEVR